MEESSKVRMRLVKDLDYYETSKEGIRTLCNYLNLAFSGEIKSIYSPYIDRVLKLVNKDTQILEKAVKITSNEGCELGLEDENFLLGIGGLSSDIEYFNGRDWVSVADYSMEDRVLQYNSDGTTELVKPIGYLDFECDISTYRVGYNWFKSDNFEKGIIYLGEDDIQYPCIVSVVNKPLVYRGGNIEIPSKDIPEWVERVRTEDVNVLDISYESRVELVECLIADLKDSVEGVLGFISCCNSKYAEQVGLLFRSVGYEIEGRTPYSKWVYEKGSEVSLSTTFPTKAYEKGMRYCFSVPSGMIVCRDRNTGVVFVTKGQYNILRCVRCKDAMELVSAEELYKFGNEVVKALKGKDSLMVNVLQCLLLVITIICDASRTEEINLHLLDLVFKGLDEFIE